ncbi:MAG: ATP-binding protein [Holophaga sp.]|jgi:two-component system nitrogen regulation sensor histidine kinase NtrY
MARTKRNPELTRLYVAVGLAVLIWVIFRSYKLLSAQVESGIDAPSRWALLALGLTNVLAIGTLLFIVARSLAKLYFERRSGILGAQIRTRLVVALFLVGIGPSLMLFLIGRTFIRKNLDRWFLPETQQVIQDGRKVAEAFNTQLDLRLRGAAAHLPVDSPVPLEQRRSELGFDLLARVQPSREPQVAAAPGLSAPRLEPLPAPRDTRMAEDGEWHLSVGPPGPKGARVVVGVFVPMATLDSMIHLERRYQESFQLSTGRETLETLPQSTFLFLTLLTLFAAVWTGLTIARTIAEPVRALAKAAQRVGRGDLEVSLPEQGEDELALLSRSFNAMTRDLLQNRSTLEAQSERIERQRAYLDQLLEALPVGVLSWQAGGTLRTFNSVARRWFGVEAWDPSGQVWEDLSKETRSGRLPELLLQVRQTRRPLSEELRIGGEGEGRPVRAAVLPLTGGGELAVLEDLSPLAQAEKRAAWQEVARRMAHEVKNPLTPIKLTTQRLLRRIREGRLDPQVVAEGAETILGEVATLTRLVDSFSRFAKLPVSQPQPLDAAELVRQAMALFVPTHGRIDWELDLPEAPLEALWDRDMVKRALVNMVDNAIAALETQTSGPPVRAGRIRVALRQEGAVARLEVEDDGPGVPEESRGHLFDPYFSTKLRGTGLGLAIVRRIAEDHGGEAYYEPLARGSRFGLTLPLRPMG